MSTQIFKNQIPNNIFFDLLDKILSILDKGQVIVSFCIVYPSDYNYSYISSNVILTNLSFFY